jgi:hypothetical protein
MANSDSRRARFGWARVFAEGMVIVASILLALAVDEWWEGHELRTAEMEVLERLAGEFEANATQLELKAGLHQRVLACGDALLEFIGSPGRGEPPVDSLSTLVWNFLFTPTYDPEDGVLNSLIASGELGIIRNDDLRVALAGWPSLVRDLKEDEDSAWRYVDQAIFPFMDGQVSFRSLHLSKSQDHFQRRSDFPIGTEDLLRNREFENFVAGRIVRVESILDPLASVEDGLATIREILHAGLNR